MNILLMCRICMENISKDTKFNIHEEKIDKSILVSSAISELFRLEIKPQDNLPQNICENCKLGLEVSVSLRAQAVKSHKKFEQIIEQSKDNRNHIIIKPDNNCFEDIESTSEELTGDDAVSFLLKNINEDSQESTDIEEPSVISESNENNIIEIVVDSEYSKRKYGCNVCSKRFMKRSNLVDHLKIHAKVKNHKCDYCEKSFAQYGNLKAHLRSHTKEKPFVCSYCPKSYTQSSALKIHIRTHTNEKSYICSICQKGFTNSSDLGKHKKIHEIDKDYKCKLCDMGFTQKIHAKKHINRFHPDSEINSLLLQKVTIFD